MRFLDATSFPYNIHLQVFSNIRNMLHFTEYRKLQPISFLLFSLKLHFLRCCLFFFLIKSRTLFSWTVEWMQRNIGGERNFEKDWGETTKDSRIATHGHIVFAFDTDHSFFKNTASRILQLQQALLSLHRERKGVLRNEKRSRNSWYTVRRFIATA